MSAERADDDGFCEHGIPAGIGCSVCEERERITWLREVYLCPGVGQMVASHLAQGEGLACPSCGQRFLPDLAPFTKTPAHLADPSSPDESGRHNPMTNRHLGPDLDGSDG